MYQRRARNYNQQPSYMGFNDNTISHKKTNSIGKFVDRHGLKVIMLSMAIGLIMTVVSVAVKNYYSANGHKFGIIRGDGNHKQCLGTYLDNKGQPKSPSNVSKKSKRLCKTNMILPLVTIVLSLIPVLVGVSYGILLSMNKGRFSAVNHRFNKRYVKLLMVFSVFGSTLCQITSLVLQLATKIDGDLTLVNIVQSGGKYGPGFYMSILATLFFVIASLFMIVI